MLMTLKRIHSSIIQILLTTVLVGNTWASTVLVVKSRDIPPYDEAARGFRSQFRDGRNSLKTIDKVDGDRSVLTIVETDRPDLIFCAGPEAMDAAAPIEKVPVVFCMVAQSKVSMMRRRADTCGVVIDLPLSGQFGIISEALPGRKRLGVMYNPEINREKIKSAIEASRLYGLDLAAVPVQSIRDVPIALDNLRNRIDVLWSILDGTAYGPETMRYVLLNTLKRDIPSIGFSQQCAKAGALMALYPDFEDMGVQAGELARDLLDRRKMPGGPVEPRRIRIAVNMKVANAMKILFSSAFLQKIDQFY